MWFICTTQNKVELNINEKNIVLIMRLDEYGALILVVIMVWLYMCHNCIVKIHSCVSQKLFSQLLNKGFYSLSSKVIWAVRKTHTHTKRECIGIK